MRVGKVTDVGRVRRTNQDTYWADPPWFVVADGMGGHAAGDVASQLALKAIKEAIAAVPGTGSDVVAAALHRANDAVWQHGQSELNHSGMGTTVTMAYINSHQCVIGHVGDSRGYLLRNGQLRQLTEDHSVVGALVRNGTLTAAEALTHPQRNLLTRAVGTHAELIADVLAVPVKAGDKLLLCTDGLTDHVNDAGILSLLKLDDNPQQIAEQLVHMANERGGADNITVVVVALPDTDSPS